MASLPPRNFGRPSNPRRSLLVPAGLALVALTGCQKVCGDDGFAWQQDPACAAMMATQPGTTTDPSTTDPDPTEATPTTEGGEGVEFCADQDGDGHGDPGACTEVPAGEDPPPGSVPNADDCDDTNDQTFPGAAELDSDTACMQDADEDGFGDADPPGGGDGPVVPGTDCDDASADTFVGAAENDDPAACMKDSDDDGWGDMNPPGGGDGPVVPGTDCDDANAAAWAACGSCVDADGDGCFGACDTPPAGCPGDGLDCDDGDPNTFPGAAPEDDANACMTDADGDDWGDNTPSSPEAEAGTDCDDGDDSAFPGAADLDSPTACMKDSDDDGHGDSAPKPGVEPGTDCNDAHDQINPSDSLLITAPISSGEIHEVDPTTGAVTPIQTLDIAAFNPWIPTSLAISPVDRSVVAALAFSDRLATLNYCGGGMPTAMPAAHKKNLCGLVFDHTGALYGIDGQLDQFLKFNADGSLATVLPLTFEGATLNVGDCGMTFDCHAQRILISDSGSGGVYAVNAADGTTTRLAELPNESFGAGLAYDPVTRQALSCLDTTLLAIALDGTNGFTPLPDLAEPADDLDYAPGCN